jgi:hypothetical protein
MNDRLPDFYMTSSESNELKQLRKCYRIKRFHAPRRDDYLLIHISPPFEIRENGIIGDQISELIIATRHKGVSLFPIVQWPVSVYVLRVVNKNPTELDKIEDDELALIGWAEIYDSQLKIH